MRKMLLGLGSAAGGLILPTSAIGAVVNFGPASTVSSTSDVDTAGAAVRAYSFGGAGPLTINGVSFTDFGSQSSDTESGLGSSYGSYGSPTLTGDANGNYATLLGHAIYHDGGSTSITLNNLTSGDAYAIEVFVNDSRGTGSRVLTVSGDTGGTAGSLEFGGISPYPSGQYAIGTFTANSTSQTLNLDLAAGSTSNNQINGLVLRDITSSPEPASLAVLGSLGSLGLLKRRRRV